MTLKIFSVRFTLKYDLLEDQQNMKVIAQVMFCAEQDWVLTFDMYVQSVYLTGDRLEAAV